MRKRGLRPYFRYFWATGLSQVLLPVPTFSGVSGTPCPCGGGRCIYLPLRAEDGFALRDNLLVILDGSATGAGLFAGEEMPLPVPEVSGKIDCLILINPNNPTGRLIEEPLFPGDAEGRPGPEYPHSSRLLLPASDRQPDLSYPDFLDEYSECLCPRGFYQDLCNGRHATGVWFFRR